MRVEHFSLSYVFLRIVKSRDDTCKEYTGLVTSAGDRLLNSILTNQTIETALNCRRVELVKGRFVRWDVTNLR